MCRENIGPGSRRGINFGRGVKCPPKKRESMSLPMILEHMFGYPIIQTEKADSRGSHIVFLDIYGQLRYLDHKIEIFPPPWQDALDRVNNDIEEFPNIRAVLESCQNNLKSKLLNNYLLGEEHPEQELDDLARFIRTLDSEIKFGTWHNMGNIER